MENGILTNHSGVTLNNFYKRVQDDRKNFLDATRNVNKYDAAKDALENEPAANKVVVAILKKNEPDINRGLIAVNKPTSGDIVQKSVRLYNATEGKKNAVGGLAAVLSNPAVITAIISLVGFLIAAFGRKAVQDEDVNEPLATKDNVSGADYLKMAQDLLTGKTGAQFDSGVKNAGLIIGGVILVFVVLIVYLVNKKK